MTSPLNREEMGLRLLPAVFKGGKNVNIFKTGGESPVLQKTQPCLCFRKMGIPVLKPEGAMLTF